jgi:hypothetical protein
MRSLGAIGLALALFLGAGSLAWAQMGEGAGPWSGRWVMG